MKLILNFLAALMIILSSNAAIPLIQDGGAREEGVANATQHYAFLNLLPLVWLSSTVFIILILLMLLILIGKNIILLMKASIIVAIPIPRCKSCARNITK